MLRTALSTILFRAEQKPVKLVVPRVVVFVYIGTYTPITVRCH